MSATSLAQSRPTKILHAGFSYGEWLGLKALFTEAAKLYNDDENGGKNEDALSLMRAVIHQCHRALVSHLDIVVGVAEDNETVPTSALTSPDQRLLCFLEYHRSHPTPEHQAWEAARGDDNKTNEYLGALHAILGTALFFFGKIIGREPALALPGEPTTALPYWLSALDVFESGHNLPVRTDVSCPSRVHWLLAMSDARVLVALVGQFITARESRRGTTEIFTRDSKWARNSPLGTIVAMRPPPTQRMALSLMTLDELMLIATDQFMRGIFHMPHHASADFPHFSRAGKLLTIAAEVLEVVERLPSAVERQQWALWVHSILDLVTPDMMAEGQRERCDLTRARCHSFIVVHERSGLVGDG